MIIILSRNYKSYKKHWWGHFQNVKLQPKRKNKGNTIDLHQNVMQKNICIIGVSYGRQVQPFTTPFL